MLKEKPCYLCSLSKDHSILVSYFYSKKKVLDVSVLLINMFIIKLEFFLQTNHAKQFCLFMGNNYCPECITEIQNNGISGRYIFSDSISIVLYFKPNSNNKNCLKGFSKQVVFQNLTTTNTLEKIFRVDTVHSSK